MSTAKGKVAKLFLPMCMCIYLSVVWCETSSKQNLRSDVVKLYEIEHFVIQPPSFDHYNVVRFHHKMILASNGPKRQFAMCILSQNAKLLFIFVLFVRLWRC